MDSAEHAQRESIWVFGYGSLLWKPDFFYRNKEVGYIQGYKRRFYQGSITHRGTIEKPGRCATLVQTSSKEDKVWGVAFEVVGQTDVLETLGYLTNREEKLGGYKNLVEVFTPRDHPKRKNVLVYTATPENDLYLGNCDLDTMAMQIATAKGQNGPNTEYVTKMADYIREHIPEDTDEHLFSLERCILDLLKYNTEDINHQPSFDLLVEPIKA